MTYQVRIKRHYATPPEVVKTVEALEDVREAVLRLEAVLHWGPSEGALTEQEVKRLDKSVTVIKVGLKIAKKSLKSRDPKKHLIKATVSSIDAAIAGG